MLVNAGSQKPEPNRLKRRILFEMKGTVYTRVVPYAMAPSKHRLHSFIPYTRILSSVPAECKVGTLSYPLILYLQASQTAFRLPLKTGDPVPLFGLQEKGWRHLRPPFHIGRAVPAEISGLTVFAN